MRFALAESPVEQPGHLERRSLPGEGRDPPQAPLPEILAKAAIGQRTVHGVRQTESIVGVDHEGGVSRDLRQRGRAGRDDRRPTSHRFEYREAEPLPERRQHEADGIRVEPAKTVLARVAREGDGIAKSQALDPFPQEARIGRAAFPADDQPARPAPAKQRKGIEKAREVLVRQQVADVQDVRILPRLWRRVGPAAEERARVVSGVDDLDLAGGNVIVVENITSRTATRPLM